jgi:hypothetical protein
MHLTDYVIIASIAAIHTKGGCRGTAIRSPMG